MDTRLRFIISIISILGVIGLARYETSTTTKISEIVYYILGSAVIGLNGKELVGIIDFIRGKK